MKKKLILTGYVGEPGEPKKMEVTENQITDVKENEKLFENKSIKKPWEIKVPKNLDY